MGWKRSRAVQIVLAGAALACPIAALTTDATESATAVPFHLHSEAVLQLDPAAWVVELFPSSHVVLPSASVPVPLSLSGKTEEAYVPTTLRMGAREFRKVTVALRRNNVASDAVGLLPAARFGSIYISHSGGLSS